jgi:hypothetical protein
VARRRRGDGKRESESESESERERVCVCVRERESERGSVCETGQFSKERDDSDPINPVHRSSKTMILYNAYDCLADFVHNRQHRHDDDAHDQLCIQYLYDHTKYMITYI